MTTTLVIVIRSLAALYLGYVSINVMYMLINNILYALHVCCHIADRSGMFWKGAITAYGEYYMKNRGVTILLTALYCIIRMGLCFLAIYALLTM